MDLRTLPLFDQLADAQHVLIAGMGGGFDVYCGLPLYAALLDAGKRVTLANLTFAAVHTGRRITRALVEIDADPRHSAPYAPEHHLCAFLQDALQRDDISVYCIQRDGAVHVQAAYQALIDRLGIDALVLVDGGTDSLMRGDEPGLGTPHEDMLSLAAADALDLPTKLVVALGFGIDRFHGVCHAYMLEAAADLTPSSGFLGAFSLLPHMPQAQLYLRAVDYANARTPGYASIVNNSIASALEGAYGDVHRTNRTQGSALWINPLMALYWTFDLGALARRALYLDRIRATETFQQVIVLLEAYEGERPRKPWRDIPV